MAAFRADVPPHVAEIIRHLPPDLKRSIKAALQALGRDPGLGEPLQRELKGLWKYRVRRFRIVYFVNRARHLIRVFGVGPSREIYEAVAAELLRRRA